MYIGQYDSFFVLLSLFVAIFASYTALDMADRIRSGQNARMKHWWLAGGACAMGIGIWSMHFIGMLAFSLPIPLGYDPVLTGVSLLIAIASSTLALWIATREVLPWRRLAWGALLMGAGVAAMHYTGMAALRMAPGIQYVSWLMAASVLIAVLAAGVALWIAFRLRRRARHARLWRCGAAVVMGLAIVGMHYTGMAAAQFPLGSICGAAGQGVASDWLALLVLVATLAVLAIALVVSVLDARLEEQALVLNESLAKANEELSYLALHDSLTKLPNRVLLADRIDQAIRSADRQKTGFALMFLDLDGFKAVNDVYGHHVGDLLLIAAAQRIGDMVRPQDTLARMGGDEFVLVAEVEDPSDAAVIAEKLVVALRAPFALKGHDDLRVSTSIGIAMYPSDGTEREALLANADAAMYHSKSQGRNTYSFFERSMNADAQAQLTLSQDLRLAIERKEFVLHYQPKFVAPDGPVTGVEALARWQHPQRGLVPPDQFIPLAEKIGLIVPISEWVLDEACRQMAIWHRAGRAEWTVAVNISALHFSTAGLVQTVQAVLARHALPPESLTLEITETTAMHDIAASLRVLDELNRIGVRISIDDFGTGYSSLMHLKRLPACELKIDRGFVRDLEHDTEDAAIISAIVALGRTLNLRVVAEGVETEDQQTFLTELGCSALQGYLLGYPMPAEALSQHILSDSL